MPSPIETFATGGKTYHKGATVAADDPAVIRLPDLFNGVKPAVVVDDAPKPTRKGAPTKAGN